MSISIREEKFRSEIFCMHSFLMFLTVEGTPELHPISLDYWMILLLVSNFLYSHMVGEPNGALKVNFSKILGYFAAIFQ